MLHNKYFKVVLVLLAVAVAVGVIYSIYYSGDTKDNVITIGNVNVHIVNNEVRPDPLVPGSVITKEVAVHNDGLSDAYIRVRFLFSDAVMGSNCTVDFNDTDWVYNSSDDFWYYPEVVEVGDDTPNLCNTITVSSSMNAEDITDFDCIIYAEAMNSMAFSGYTAAWNYIAQNK